MGGEFGLIFAVKIREMGAFTLTLYFIGFLLLTLGFGFLFFFNIIIAHFRLKVKVFFKRIVPPQWNGFLFF